MEKKKRFSFLKLLVIILCIAAVIVSAGANILFSGGKTPALFGRHIYIVGDDNPMAGDITAGAALIAKDAEGVTINPGDIVLCYPADNPGKLCLRSITVISEADNGAQAYYTKDSLHEDSAGAITKSSIAAVCTGYPESLELGRFITFARSVTGIIVLLGVPVLLLLIFIISAVARSKRSDDSDEYDFYEYDDDEDEEEEENGRYRNNDPLYEPDSDIAVKPELERKKMSIAENFSQKQVNPNSPYQREKERTMQFKAQKTGSAESAFAARNPGAQTSAVPTADALREEMLRKTAEAEGGNTASFTRISDNTGVLSKAQVAELSRGSAGSRTSAAPKAAPKKSDSPDISDIIGKSRSSASKKSPSDMSVDDLLKMIEDQKNKF
ncbi:MAG: hypothetical protein J6K77_00470 [Ruminococcus sp.]|nr:hypothetical protein [Ruminococcus sp.]